MKRSIDRSIEYIMFNWKFWDRTLHTFQENLVLNKLIIVVITIENYFNNYFYSDI